MSQPRSPIRDLAYLDETPTELTKEEDETFPLWELIDNLKFLKTLLVYYDGDQTNYSLTGEYKAKLQILKNYSKMENDSDAEENYKKLTEKPEEPKSKKPRKSRMN